MEDINDYLSIKKCDCGRKYCQFFGGAVGDYGTSFSKESIQLTIKEIEQQAENIPKVITHLKKLLSISQE